MKKKKRKKKSKKETNTKTKTKSKEIIDHHTDTTPPHTTIHHHIPTLKQGSFNYDIHQLRCIVQFQPSHIILTVPHITDLRYRFPILYSQFTNIIFFNFTSSSLRYEFCF